jgi:hypothetical protein
MALNIEPVFAARRDLLMREMGRRRLPAHREIVTIAAL